MGLTIKQATWGDEAGTTDITRSLQNRASSGYVDMVADASLVPAITLEPQTTVSLTDEDNEKAHTAALKECGGGSDEKCVEARVASFEASALQTKIAEASSSKDIVKGRRLTVTFVDSTGREKTLQIPDGQKLTMGNPPIIKTDKLFGELSSIAFYILLTALWVFSVVITYRTLISAGWIMLGYALTAVAVLIPYSGLIMTPIAFLAINYISKTDIMRA